MKIFELLSKEERKQCNHLTFKKDEFLFHEDDKCEHVGIVIKGQIDIVSYTLSGQEIIYNQIKQGEMFGNNLLFSEQPFYKGNVICRSNGELLLINKQSLLSILQTNKAFLEKYLSYQADFTKKLNGKIKLLSLSSAEERLLYFLKGKNEYHLSSVTDLAKQLHLSREATSRLITKLVNEGRINRVNNALLVKH